MKNMQDAAEFDPRMAAAAGGQDAPCWHGVPCAGLRVRGLGFFGQDRAWCRLPLGCLPEVRLQRPALLPLARHMAGASLRFCTDSPEIWLRAALGSPPYISHMAPTAQCGFDCYAQKAEGGGWKLAGVTKFELGKAELCCRVAEHLPPGAQVQINLPLYTGVEQIELGLVPGARLWEAPPEKGPAAAFYGTSITQGGCASRPGMAYPAILERMLGVPVYNMGFSGNGVGTPALAPVFCSLPGLGALVVDIEANAGPEGRLEHTLPRFLDAVRAYRPDLPVLVLAGAAQSGADWDPAFAQRCSGWAAFERQEVEHRRAAGDQKIHFASARFFLKDLGTEATVDGIHLTDLGFLALARGLAPVLQELFLGEEG